MLYNGRVDDLPKEIEDKIGLLYEKSKSKNIFGLTPDNLRFSWLELDNLTTGENPEWKVEPFIDAVVIYRFFQGAVCNRTFPFDILIDADFQSCHNGAQLSCLRNILFNCGVMNESDRKILINMPGLDDKIMYTKTKDVIGDLGVIETHHLEYLWQLFFCAEGAVHGIIEEAKFKMIDYGNKLSEYNMFIDEENRKVRCFTPIEALIFRKQQVIKSKKTYQSINKKYQSMIDESRSNGQTCYEEHNRSLESQIDDNKKWINKLTGEIKEINKMIKSQNELEKTRQFR